MASFVAATPLWRQLPSLQPRRRARRGSPGSSVTLFSGKRKQSSAVQNGSRVQRMQVWNPIGLTKFETFSYLPALSDDRIAKQVDYMIQQKLIPCLEFDVIADGVSRANNQSPALLDDVEAADVRVQRPGARAARDRGVQEGVPQLLRAQAGLRQREAGADLRLPRRQAQRGFSIIFNLSTRS